MFHHAVELFLWLLLAFVLGAIIGCLVRAAMGRGRRREEFRLTGPMLSDAYKTEGGRGTPVGRALGLMGSGEPPAAAKMAGIGMASATAAAAGATAKAASAKTATAGESATKKEGKKKAAGKEAAGSATSKPSGKKAADRKAAAGKAAAEKAAESAADGKGKDEKWNVPLYGLDKPTAGEPDNLQIISGIGPKLEKLLHDLGIYYFAQITRWTKKDIAAVDDKLKFKGRIERDEWVRQAKLLAEGKMEQFEREYGTGGLKDKSGKTRSGTRTRRKK